jgi:hypothetical protein
MAYSNRAWTFFSLLTLVLVACAPGPSTAPPAWVVPTISAPCDQTAQSETRPEKPKDCSDQPEAKPPYLGIFLRLGSKLDSASHAQFIADSYRLVIPFVGLEQSSSPADCRLSSFRRAAHEFLMLGILDEHARGHSSTFARHLAQARSGWHRPVSVPSCVYRNCLSHWSWSRRPVPHNLAWF